MKHRLKTWAENAVPGVISAIVISLLTFIVTLHQSSNETKVEIAKLYGSIAVLHSQVADIKEDVRYIKNNTSRK